tara:strand:- start:57 stop:2165 length:2109 start_codon:yes stop_codon:yes gene_type:complete
MTVEKKLLVTGARQPEVEDDPIGVAFGPSDYAHLDNTVSTFPSGGRGRSLTFSCWFYVSESETHLFIAKNVAGQTTFKIDIKDWGLRITATEEGVTRIHGYAQGNNDAFINGWHHLLISLDAISTSSRHIYVDDVAWPTTWSTYTANNYFFNDIDDFYVAGHSQAKPKRLAHVFFDWDPIAAAYLDLSTTSNRRKFIDADKKPVTVTGLSPYIYLPLISPTSVTTNSGSLGNFTASGVLDSPARGPNQDNCYASTVDGNNQWMSMSTVPTGLSDGKLFTFSFNASQTTGNGQIFTASNGQVSIKLESRQCTVRLGNSGGAVLYFSTPATVASKLYYGQHNHWCFSCDLSDTSKRHMFLNGVDITSGINFIHYVNAVADLTHTPNAIGAGATGGDKFNGSIGEFYLDDSYIDLATENPFWNSDFKKPVPLYKVIEDTGVTPVIAMPIMGKDVGNNLGSGGDFYVYSGRFTGARGGSEFWTRSADFSSTNHLSKSSSWGNSSNYTFAVAFRPHNTSGFKNLFVANDPHAAQYGLRISQDDAKIEVQQKNTSNANFVNAAFSGLVANTWYVFLASFSVGASKFSMEIRGGVTNSYSTTSLSNTGQVRLQGTTKIGGGSYGNFDGDIGFVYLSRGYVDISQESNRNKFVDQLGYPKDLTPLIDAGDIPSPVVYMKLEDTAALGTNSGTGGDFTVSGSLVAGPDVDP